MASPPLLSSRETVDVVRDAFRTALDTDRPGEPKSLAVLICKLGEALVSAGLRPKVTRVPMWRASGAEFVPTRYTRFTWRTSGTENRVDGHLWWYPNNVYRAIGTQGRVRREAMKLSSLLSREEIDGAFVLLVDQTGLTSHSSLRRLQRACVGVACAGWSRGWGRLDSSPGSS